MRLRASAVIPILQMKKRRLREVQGHAGLVTEVDLNQSPFAHRKTTPTGFSALSLAGNFPGQLEGAAPSLPSWGDLLGDGTLHRLLQFVY